MLISYLVLSAFCTCYVTSMYIVEPGPKYPPTKGEIWPKPQYEKKEKIYYILDPLDYKVDVKHECSILQTSIERYVSVVRSRHGVKKNLRRDLERQHSRYLPTDENYKGKVLELQIDLTGPCEEYPYFGMDESYNLTVSTNSILVSSSVWGMMRGLETLTQLIYFSEDYSEMLVNKTEIYDYPRYSHRGLLLDTSRHYISIHNILLTLDAMSMNKMNVFHWHIVDDQSFPYQSEKFPTLSALGAYHPSMVYTKGDIQRVIVYAAQRGIRVIPEFDVPGHTRSWGVAFPNILTECYKGQDVIGLGPMNPIHNSTYKLLRELFQEIQNLFPDRYFHIGGDEVDLECWSSNYELLEFMAENNLSSVSELHAVFMERAIPLLSNDSIPIVWQEVFDEKVPLTKQTIVQVWKNSWIYEMIKVLSAGYKVIFSSSWYLDHLSSGGDWEVYYNSDPETMVNNDTLAQNIVGGEACMWAEVVDNNNVIARVWPRASAVAERLWSGSKTIDGTTLDYVRRRLEEHTCRMNRRGIAAQPPNGPGFCIRQY